MSIVSMIFNFRKLLSPDDYVTERTRRKYEDLKYDLPIPPNFDETKSKYKSKK